tara:strand:- start:132 stop:740 length:609 start_codon:yes stop_codon:yes gene_type:complete
MEELKTGDVLLLNSESGWFKNLFGKIIKWGTHSNYTHVVMVLKDPVFLHPHLKGIYVWESGWEGTPDPQDGDIKLGVQITSIEQFLNSYKRVGGHCYLRSINCDNEKFSVSNLSNVHEVVYKKPYDICPLDWVEAFLGVDINSQKTSRYWCSALVGYIYTKCGILDQETDWSILKPSDFSLDGENLSFQYGCSLSMTQTKIF